MMRTNLHPLARLVDTAAERWLAVENAPYEERMRVRQDITANFNIGDKAEITFHGLRYQMCVTRDVTEHREGSPVLLLAVHEIALNG